MAIADLLLLRLLERNVIELDVDLDRCEYELNVDERRRKMAINSIDQTLS
jgi:hypothetical protein